MRFIDLLGDIVWADLLDRMYEKRNNATDLSLQFCKLTIVITITKYHKENSLSSDLNHLQGVIFSTDRWLVREPATPPLQILMLVD